MVSIRSQTLRVHQIAKLCKMQWVRKNLQPAATFISKILLISEFVKELFDNDDFKEEYATIYIMVSLTLCIFRHKTFL